MLAKTRAYAKSYDWQTKLMNFLIKNDDILEEYNTILNKVSVDLKNWFHSEPVYNDRFLKTKIKSYDDEVTDFYKKEIPKVDSNPTCLAVISLDSGLNKYGNYYPQVLSKECKYIEKKFIRHIDDLESSCNDFDEE